MVYSSKVNNTRLYRSLKPRLHTISQIREYVTHEHLERTSLGGSVRSLRVRANPHTVTSKAEEGSEPKRVIG